MTGDTLKPEINNPDKEYFVFFTNNDKKNLQYWRALIYEFAERYENVTDVVFGELDQAHNEPEGQHFKTLPYFVYYPKGDNKTGVHFERT